MPGVGPASLEGLMQGSVKYYPLMDGGDSLVTENLASLLFPPVLFPGLKLKMVLTLPGPVDHLGPTRLPSLTLGGT